MAQLHDSALPLDKYTLLAFAVAIFVIFLILAFFAFQADRSDLSKISEVVYFQEKIHPNHPIYLISMRIKDLMQCNGTTDLIFRLRGAVKDSPVILYRNHDCSRISPGQVLNLGVAIPYDLGSLVEVDMACDNSIAEESEPILCISDLFVRKLPRKASNLKRIAKMNESAILRTAATELFEGMSDKVRTWAGTDTLTAKGGIGIVGISVTESGREQMLRARDLALSFSMEEEKEYLKRKNFIGFRPQHYLFSISSNWHDLWSDFSRFDVVAVICLDIIANVVLISLCFAYGIESVTGAQVVAEFINGPRIAYLQTAFDYFNLYDLSKDSLSVWYSNNMDAANEAIWTSLICSLCIVPLSVLWSRLFRLIGGKGYEHALKLAQSPEQQDEDEGIDRQFSMLRASAGLIRSLTNISACKMDNNTPSNHLMLRTLECRNEITASTVMSTRRLRMEPLIANCPPDDITARSVAYVRTKMSRLRDESIPSGSSHIKKPLVLHESHTHSTDSPEMPLPTKLPGQKGEVVRVARYCERLVQQATQHIHDNSVIAECFEVDPDPNSKRDDNIDFSKCCPRHCCGCKPEKASDKIKETKESFSNQTFFNEEDALSVHELMTQFPTIFHPQKKDENVIEENVVEEFANQQMAIMDDEYEDDEEEENEESTEQASYSDSRVPSASAKRWKQQSKRDKAFTKELKIKVENRRKRTTRLKNNGCEDGGKERVVLPSMKRHEKRIKEKGNEELAVLNRSRGHGDLSKKKTKRQPPVRFDYIRNISSDDSNSQCSTKVKRKHKVKKSKAKKNSNELPFPSGMPREVAYNPVAGSSLADWASAQTHFSDSMADMPTLPEVPKKLPFKGNVAKISVFLFLVCLQTIEIYFMSAFETSINTFYFDFGEKRMHGALFSALMGVFFYFAVAIHLVALLSFAVEFIRDKLNPQYEQFYNEA